MRRAMRNPPWSSFTFERRDPRPAATCRSRSCTAASATPICTRPATTGATRCTRWCRATKSSAAWSRRRAGEEAQGRRLRRRRLHGRLLPHMCRLQRRTWSSIASRAPPGPTTPGAQQRAARLRRLLGPDRRRRALRRERPPQAST